MSLFERDLPLSFEPVSTNADDIIVLDSDVEDDGYRSATKRRRVEDIGYRYMLGQTINIFAAGLRGPFEESWINPSLKTGVRAPTWKRLPQRKPLRNGQSPSRRNRPGNDPRIIRGNDSPRDNTLYEATEAAAAEFVVEPDKNIIDRKRLHVTAETDDRSNEAYYFNGHDDSSERRRSPDPSATSVHIVDDRGGHEDRGSRRDDRRREDLAKSHQGSTSQTTRGGPNVVSSNHDTIAKYTSLSRQDAVDASGANTPSIDQIDRRPNLDTSFESSERGLDAATSVQGLGAQSTPHIVVGETSLDDAEGDVIHSWKCAKALSFQAASQASRANSVINAQSPSVPTFLPSPVDPGADIEAGLVWTCLRAPASRSPLESSRPSLSQPLPTTEAYSPLEHASNPRRAGSSPLQVFRRPHHAVVPLTNWRMKREPNDASARPGSPSMTVKAVSTVEVPPDPDAPPVRAWESPGRPEVAFSQRRPMVATRPDPASDHSSVSPQRTESPTHIPGAVTDPDGEGISRLTLFEGASPLALSTIRKTYGGSGAGRQWRPSSADATSERLVSPALAHASSPQRRPSRSRSARHDGLKSALKGRPTVTMSLNRSGARNNRERAVDGSVSEIEDDRTLDAVMDEMMDGVLDSWDVETHLKQQAERRRSSAAAAATAPNRTGYGHGSP